jgi:hypothetical protein
LRVAITTEQLSGFDAGEPADAAIGFAKLRMMLRDLNQARWHAGDYRSGGKALSHNRSCAHYTSVAQNDILQDDRLRAHPTFVAYDYLASIHAAFDDRPAFGHGVVGVCNINARPEHVAIADLDVPARVNHAVAIEIVAVTHTNPDAIVIGVNRPQPTAFRQRVPPAQFDLAGTSGADSFEAASGPDLHAKPSIEQYPVAAEQAVILAKG